MTPYFTFNFKCFLTPLPCVGYTRDCRLHVRSVNMRGRWPAQPQLVADPGNPRVSPRKGSESLFPDDAQDNGVCMQIRVDEFASESVGEHFE